MRDMNEFKKKAAVLLLHVLAVVLIIAMFRAVFSNSFGSSGRNDSERTERHEDRMQKAEGYVEVTERGLSEIGSQVRGIKDGIGNSITGIGEIRDAGSRIAGETERSEESVARIELGISRIERILGKTGEENKILEVDDRNTGGGSSY